MIHSNKINEDGMSKKTKILFVTLIVLLIGVTTVFFEQQLTIIPLKIKVATDNITFWIKSQLGGWQ
jgi:hypothetical protein